MNNLGYHLILQFTVFIWGFTGILGEVITLPQEQLVWYRMAIAFLSLGIFLALQRPRWNYNLRTVLVLFLTGGVIAAHWVLFFGAIKVSTISIAVVCMATQSVFISILQPVFMRTGFIWYELLLGFLALCGIALIYGVETQYTTGILLGLASSFFASVFTMLNGKLVQEIPPLVISTVEMLAGVILLSVYIAFSVGFDDNWFSVSGRDWMYLLLLGIICTAVAFAVSVFVMKRLSPFTVSISVNLEPIYTIILALLLLGDSEHMSMGFYIGSLIIFSTVIANAWIKSRYKSKLFV